MGWVGEIVRSSMGRVGPAQPIFTCSWAQWAEHNGL